MKRRTNIFEKLLLVIGVAITVLGFFLLNVVFNQGGSVFDISVLTALFLWLLLIFFMIQCAISENMREELGIIIKEHVEETKLLRDISSEHLEEIKLLRAELNTQHKKKK